MLYNVIIGAVSESLTADSTLSIDVMNRPGNGTPAGGPALTDAELNALADAFVSILNTKYGVTDFEVPGITRADQTNVPVT